MSLLNKIASRLVYAITVVFVSAVTVTMGLLSVALSVAVPVLACVCIYALCCR